MDFAARAPSSPIIGITCDLQPHPKSGRMMATVAAAYADRVSEAGGTPVLLAPRMADLASHLAACRGFVLTGGDDPRTEEFGVPTHPKASVMNADRQRYEVELLRRLQTDYRDQPVLGICLGMQLMSLVAGGRLDQHLPETLASHESHYSREHWIRPEAGGLPSAMFASGSVASHHRQAVADPGWLQVLARAEDGVIEAVGDLSRRFCFGVQWHPERTADPSLGLGVFQRLIDACRR